MANTWLMQRSDPPTSPFPSLPLWEFLVKPPAAKVSGCRQKLASYSPPPPLFLLLGNWKNVAPWLSRRKGRERERGEWAVGVARDSWLHWRPPKYRPQDQTTWHVGAGLSRSEMGQAMGSVGQTMHA